MNKLYALFTRKHFNNNIGILRGTLLLLLFMLAANAGKAQLILTNVAPSATIDFSNLAGQQITVGTNPISSFTANGFEPNPTTAGRLNSNAWSTTGWSEPLPTGGLAFGGSAIAGGTDYTRGPIAIPITQGGIYAYTGAPNSVANPALMMQPGGSDFTPGTLTLKIQNNGTTLINKLAVSYNIYLRNDQARSQSFNFSYSTDNVTYTALTALDYATPPAADGAGWVSVARATGGVNDITGISIMPGGGVFYIRWTSDDVSGAGSRDEIGLDDINVTGNFVTACAPPTAQASLNGINNLLCTQMDLDILRGDGTGGVLIVATQGTTLAPVALTATVGPTSGVTYHANSNFGTGDAIGNGFVIYNSNAIAPLGSGSFTLTGLLPNTFYSFYYFEYNISVPCYSVRASVNTDDQQTNTTCATNAADQFRSKSSGNWANAFTWQSFTGGTWGDADMSPTSASAGIAVQFTHTVDVSCPVSMDQTSVAGLLTLSDDGLINLNNGAGNDIDIISGGVLRTQSTKNYSLSFAYTGGPSINVSNAGKITIGNGGSAPGYSALGFTSGLGIWNTGSILEWNSTDPFVTAGGITYFPDAAAGTIPIFRISRTPSLQPGSNANTTWKGLLEVNANLTLKLGGIKTFRNGIIGTATLFQDDDCAQFVIDGATAQLGGTGAINLNSGGLAINSPSVTSMISNKTINSTLGAGTLFVNGSLYCSSFVMSGSGIFTLSGGGTLGIGSADGITPTAGVTGNIQVGGARTYDITANYIYNGTGNQITGTGLPATINTLTIANTGGAGNNTVSNTRIGTTTINSTTAAALTLTSGLLTVGAGNTISLAGENGGITATAGNFSSSSSGSITFLATNTVTGAVDFYPDVFQTPPSARGVNYGTSSVVHGLLQLNANSFVNINAPTYLSGSLLKYNLNTTYGRRVEWSTGSGNGYPYNVQISNNTVLSPAKTAGFNSTVFNAAGNVTIDNGSAIYLDEGGFNMLLPLTVGGNLVINGALSGSQVAPGDIVVAGNWTRSSTGSFFPNDRAVFFNGSGNSIIIANVAETFDYLYFTKNAVGNTVSLVDNINVRKEFGMNTGTLDLAGKNVTLLSTATATATFANFGAGTPANASINYSGAGRFIVQRFIPIGTGGANHGKTWQFLSTPTKGQTVNQSWQEGNAPLVVGTSGLGIIISSNTAGAGFDIIGGVGPSMKTYNSAGAGSWVGIANTTSLQIAEPKGYMIFVRGDRTVTAYNQTATATTLRTTGKLYVPGAEAPPATTVTAGKFESIGNPYASAIDFTFITKPAAPDVDDAFYVWDPTLAGTWGLGGFQTMNAATGWAPSNFGTTNYPTNTAVKTIQSGQAFFVHATGAGGTVSFTEACKVGGSKVVFKPGNTVADRAYLRTRLYTAKGIDGVLADANIVAFDTEFENAYDANDALKIMNQGENFAIASNQKILAIEARRPFVNTDTIFYKFSNLRKQAYELRFSPENMPVTTLEAFLVDKYLDTKIAVSLTTATMVSFAINDDQASAAEDRFMLVFRGAVPVPQLEFADVKATRKDNNILVEWKIKNELNIDRYEVERSIDGISFSKQNEQSAKGNGAATVDYDWLDTEPLMGYNFYRIRSVSNDNKINYSNMVKAFFGKKTAGFVIYPNPVKDGLIGLQVTQLPAGTYSLRLYNNNGQLIFFDKLYHSGIDQALQVQAGSSLAKGIYRLEIYGPAGMRQARKLLVN